MPVKAQVLISAMEAWAPKRLAADWDNVGLQVGDPADDVYGVLVTLDVDEAALAEAEEAGANFVVTHHPLIFKPISHLRRDLPLGRLISKAVAGGVGVYAAHTNLDSARGGVNDTLAAALGLADTEVLSATYEEPLIKLAVFVPRGHAEAVREALARAGAGHIGNYSDTAFWIEGKGFFRPQEGTHPYIGEHDKLEEVEEVRLETILPRGLTGKVVKAMLAAHPYEEVAYDLYPLANSGEPFGLGRIGLLPGETDLQAMAAKVKDVLGVAQVGVVGDRERSIKKVAVCGGSGGGLIHQAAFRGADLFITGDIKYHDAQEARQLDLAIIDAGHFATERVILPVLAEKLRQALVGAGHPEVPVTVAGSGKDPFEIL